MANEISLGTWTGIASCAVSCGCWFASAIQSTQARQIQSAQPIDNLSDLKELLHLLPLFVAVTGTAWTSRPIKCELADEKAVLVDYKELKHVRSRNDQVNWTPHLEQVCHLLRSTPWSLRNSSGFMLPVIDAEKADDLYLPLAGQVYIDADTGESSSSTTSRIALRTMDALQGFKVMGTQKVEKALPVGTALTAIGEVVSTQPGSSKGTLRLQKPRNGKPFVISNKSLDDIVHSYHHNAAGCKAAAVFFGSIGLAIFGTKVAQYGYFRWKEWRIRRRREEADQRRLAERQARAAAGVADGNGDGNQAAEGGGGLEDGVGTCVICLERDSDTVFQACGHMCTCNDCSVRLNRCPICRTRTRAIRVYRT
ncbi:hypothetical protein ABBQ38_009525 [Trebouxia sp. C0009 RCD-2024]